MRFSTYLLNTIRRCGLEIQAQFNVSITFIPYGYKASFKGGPAKLVSGRIIILLATLFPTRKLREVFSTIPLREVLNRGYKRDISQLRSLSSSKTSHAVGTMRAGDLPTKTLL